DFRHLDDQFFLKKRFGTSFFQDHAGALMVNLELFEFPGYLALFFTDMADCDPDRIRNELSFLIRDLIPVLQRRRVAREQDGQRNNPSMRTFNLLRWMSGFGKKEFVLASVRFVDLLEY